MNNPQQEKTKFNLSGVFKNLSQGTSSAPALLSPILSPTLSSPKKIDDFACKHGCDPKVFGTLNDVWKGQKKPIDIVALAKQASTYINGIPHAITECYKLRREQDEQVWQRERNEELEQYLPSQSEDVELAQKRQDYRNNRGNRSVQGSSNTIQKPTLMRIEDADKKLLQDCVALMALYGCEETIAAQLPPKLKNESQLPDGETKRQGMFIEMDTILKCIKEIISESKDNKLSPK